MEFQGIVLSLYMEARFGASAGALGVLFGLLAVATAVSAVLGGMLADRLQARWVVVACGHALYALLSLSTAFPSSFWLMGIVFVLLGLSFGVITVSLSLLEEVASATGLLFVCQCCVGALRPLPCRGECLLVGAAWSCVRSSSLLVSSLADFSLCDAMRSINSAFSLSLYLSLTDTHTHSLIGQENKMAWFFGLGFSMYTLGMIIGYGVLCFSRLFISRCLFLSLSLLVCL
jgi:hypothetical protein